jgi:hypothetical protein
MTNTNVQKMYEKKLLNLINNNLRETLSLYLESVAVIFKQHLWQLPSIVIVVNTAVT